MKCFDYHDAPYLTQVLCSCCGAYAVSPPPEVGVKEFEEETLGTRYGGHIAPKETPGLLVLKPLLLPSHPIVEEVQRKKPEGWNLLPFEEKFFVFKILEAAKMPSIKEKVLDGTSEWSLSLRPVSLNLYSLLGSPCGVKGIEKMVKKKGVYVAVAVAADSHYELIAVKTWEAAGFTSWPFTHRVHSGNPRRMILQTFVQTKEES